MDDDELAKARGRRRSWPANWPRIAATPNRGAGRQTAHFIGGNADGLRDQVAEIAPGQLPQRLESMGSIYGLADGPGQEPTYHVTPNTDG